MSYITCPYVPGDDELYNLSCMCQVVMSDITCPYVPGDDELYNLPVCAR